QQIERPNPLLETAPKTSIRRHISYSNRKFPARVQPSRRCIECTLLPLGYTSAGLATTKPNRLISENGDRKKNSKPCRSCQSLFDVRVESMDQASKDPAPIESKRRNNNALHGI